MPRTIPQHVAIIMDGNGRWAKKRFLTRAAGHRAGAKALRSLATEAEKIGVKYLTVYAFSTENWNRPKDEVDALMKLLREYIQEYIDDSNKNNMRISVIGDVSRLDDDLQGKIRMLEDITKHKNGLHVIIAMNYGGRDEITRVARIIADEVKNGGLNPQNIDENLISAYLDTKDIPDPDLLIRTSGEMRLSNFLLWQSAYSELVFNDKLWPDFTINDLNAAIDIYNDRERRFGGR